MRLVIARCSVDYEGRLSAHLPEAVRLIMVKADGCVAIHADGGAYKPLNWMNAPNTLVTGDDAWLVTNPKGERLTITMHEVVHDSLWELGVDPGLQKDGVEAHLQELLAASPHTIEDGFRLVRREYPTAIGPIDLVCRDGNDQVVAIEVKRRGEIDGVEQLTRYIERLHLDSSLGAGARRVRRPGRQAAGPRAGRGTGLPLGRGRLRRRSAAWPRRTCGCSDPTCPSESARSGRFRRTERLRSPAMPQEVRGVVAKAKGEPVTHRDDRRSPTPAPARPSSRSRRAASATPTCTTARAGSTTSSRSCSATRPPARSRPSARASPRSPRATTSSSTGGPSAGSAGRACAASRGTASPPTTRRRR